MKHYVSHGAVTISDSSFPAKCSAVMRDGGQSGESGSFFASDGADFRQFSNRMVRQMAGDNIPIKRIVRLTGLRRGLVRQIICGEREDVFRIRESSRTP